MERSLRCCLPPSVLQEREVQALSGHYRRNIIGNFKIDLRRKAVMTLSLVLADVCNEV